MYDLWFVLDSQKSATRIIAIFLMSVRNLESSVTIMYRKDELSLTMSELVVY